MSERKCPTGCNGQPMDGKVNPECQKMHEAGYCICLTVACIACGKHHAPHKPCPKEK